MHLTLRYFASLREAMGCEAELLEFSGDAASTPCTAATLLAYLQANHERFAAATTAISPVQMAVNHEVANPGTKLACGAEVAFFPPVTGG